MRVWRVLVPIGLLLLRGGPASAGEDLAAALERAVDLPDPAARAEAARAIARREDATLPNLLAAMRAFGRFEKVVPGVRDEVVTLHDGRIPVEAEVTVYVPPAYDPAKPAPLLLALHGAGGDGRREHERWKGTADALGMLILAPSDPGPNQGYEFTAEERALALSALRWARRNFNLDENRVFVTGVSRGGHLAWDLALRHTDLFAAAAPMIGGPRISNQRGENNLRYLENVRDLPIRDLQGSRDHPLLLANLRLAFERLAGWRAADAKLLEFPDLGHEFEFGAVDWTEWLGNCRRDPTRERVVVRAVEAAEGRRAWVELLRTGSGAKEEIVLRVDPKRWNALDEDAKRRAFLDQAERVTARLEVTRTGPGDYRASGKLVDRFRILLPEGAWEPGNPVVVHFNGRTRRLAPEPDPALLLAEFVERFDRTFLPVAEVEW